MKSRFITWTLASAALAVFLATGAPASAGTAASASQGNAPAPEAIVTLIASPTGQPISRANPAAPNANVDTWKVVGARCTGNPYSWCDMFAHAIVFAGTTILDQYTVRLKFDPHWQSVDVIWTVTTHNVHHYLTDFRATVHVMCLSNRDCRDQEHALAGQGGSSFKVQYPENLKGRLVLFGLEFQANCPRCAVGLRHPDAKGRTREARCLKTSDKCKFV